MQAIALKPSRAQYTALYLGLVLLALCSVLLPPVGFAAALLLPLVGSPLLRTGQEWAAWAAYAVPCAVSLVSGYHPLYSLSLLLPGALCFLALKKARRRRGQVSTMLAIALCVAAYAAAMTLMALCASLALGDSLADGLKALVLERVASSDRPGLVLYRLAAAGLANVPKAYRNANLLFFAFDPALIRQLTLSFQLTLERLLSRMIPSLFAHVCLLGGLFTALNYARFHCAALLVETNPRVPSERKTYVLPPLRFSMLTVPRPLRWPLFAMGLCGVLLVVSDGSLEVTLGWLLYTAFCAILQLQGAAAFLFLLDKRSPERTALHGALMAVLYVVIPPVLFWFGAADLLFHFRTKDILNHQEEE